MDATDKVLQRLPSARKISDGRYMARCPAHKDKTPSLAITRGEKGVLLHCFGGCDVSDICAALELEPSDLFDVQRRDYGKPIRPFVGRQVLTGLGDELAVALFLIRKSVKRHGLSLRDQRRLARAQEKVEECGRMI